MILLFFSTAGKVCVSLLTILSGFGLAKSYSKFQFRRNSIGGDIRFVCSHIVQLYSIYWIMFLINICIRYHSIDSLSALYGQNYTAVFKFLIDFLGLSKLFQVNGVGDWYISALIVFYILFPLIYRIAKHLHYWIILLTAVPWVVKLFFPNLPCDNAIFYLLSFSTGIIIAQTGILDRIKLLKQAKYKILSIIFLLLSFVLRLVFSLFADYLFAISIIVFGTLVLSSIKGLNKLLVLFGKNSANIWLLHGSIIALAGEIIVLPILIKYLVVLTAALVISILLELLKKKVGYNTLLIKVRKRIEN